MRALLISALLCAIAMTAAAKVTVPFDFSKTEVAVDASIRGRAVFVLIDTGVDPSLIDLHLAETLGFKIDRGEAGEASGFGDGKGAAIYAVTIDGIQIGTHNFGSFVALASDLNALSSRFGRSLDAIIGYSFLTDKIVMFDYPQKLFAILDRSSDVKRIAAQCRKHWSTKLDTVESYPVIPKFRFGNTVGPITIDTGANSGIGLYQSALDDASIRSALIEQGAETHTGARGDATTASYKFDAPVGFGPFELPAGQIVSTHKESGSRTTRVANVGNALFAAMNLRIILDYRSRQMTFLGDCR